MVWPSKALGSLYSALYAAHGCDVLALNDAARIIGGRSRAKVYLHRLKKRGWAFPFPRAGEGTYRLQRPEVCVLIEAGRIKALSDLRQQEYAGLLGTFAADVRESVAAVKGMVLFGSLSRGKARHDSDVDLLTVIERRESVRPAFAALTKLEQEGRTKDELRYLASHGITTHLSLLPMSKSHLATHPFILLDIVEEGLTIFDDGAFEFEASEIRRGLRRLGARRVFLDEGDWYWDLIPSYRKGVSVEI